jgi:hypothetical protein
MIRSLTFFFVLLSTMSITTVMAQKDRVIHISHQIGESTYYLSFEDGGGGELVTKKMSNPGPDESFFLQSFGPHKLGGELYLITSLEGFVMRMDEDQQLIADQKEACIGCFFRITGKETLTIYAAQDWMLNFSVVEEAFVMQGTGAEVGKTDEEKLKQGLSLQGYDIPGGLEGVDVFRTLPGLDEFIIQFPDLWKEIKLPDNPLQVPENNLNLKLQEQEKLKEKLQKTNQIEIKNNLEH